MSGRSIALSVRALLIAAVLALVPPAAAQEPPPIRTDATIVTTDGYGRLVFHFAEANEADVRLSSGVLVITFKRPIEVDVNRLTVGNEYISAARRDPDGKGVRFALMQRVRVSSMVAGERFFVDLLPESWTAAPPPLPKEVVEDLARRAREAERKIQQSEGAARQRIAATARVRVSRQPTFVRYVFELPEFISVNADRQRDKLVLTFDTLLRFDLADAKAVQPQIIQSIETTASDASTSVIFSLIGKVDMRSFREDNNFVVDFLVSEPVRGLNNVLPPGRAALEPPAEPKLPPQMARNIDTIIDPAKAARAAPMPPPPGLPAAREAAPPAAAPPVATPSVAAPPAAAPAPETAPAAESPAEAPAPAIASAPSPVAPAATPPATTPAVAAAPAPPSATRDAAAITLQTRGDHIRLLASFLAPTPAAVFTRADTLWLAFETTSALDAGAIAHDSIRQAELTKHDNLQVLRLKLDRPRLVGATLEDNTWTIQIGDTLQTAPQAVSLIRNVGRTPRASAYIPFDHPGNLHRLQDPEIGDTLLLVTALGPPRGIPKTQDFVDFRALATAQGVVFQPLADDLKVELASDRIVVGRPGGLTLTSAAAGAARGGAMRPLLFDAQQWGFDRQANFLGRSTTLMLAAAQAPEAKRVNARMELARFYFARDMYVEAKGVLDSVIDADRPSADDTAALVMRGLAKIMMGRPEEGLKDIDSPIVGNQNDAQLWRALASARQGKWAEAREGFRKVDVTLGMLPIELQRQVMMESLRSAIEVGDFAAAATQLAEFETLGLPPDAQPALQVLTGRVHEGLGRSGDALMAYRAAAESNDRAAAAQGRLREVALRFRTGDIQRAEVIPELEALTATWRGDDTEIEALQLLARLYLDDARYRDAFNVMRTAVRVHPRSEMTRAIQDDAAAAFDKLFLGGKVDSLPAIEALALFYDFRELVPIGRRGDEMIRRLSDRLVMVDLLDQAAELLQHQIDHRLQGAARAQVATRLATIYLMNRKPERALHVLNVTRSNELSSEIRNHRLLLEARALADTGRPNLAIEVMEHIPGPQAARARADVLWSAKRYREAAEQIELMYGDRWRDFNPLNDTERRDILRAALGFNFGEDPIGLERFREKYGPAMAQTVDRRAFEVVSAPQLTPSDEFNEVARSIAAIDTLDQFLADIRARLHDASVPSARAGQPPQSQSRLKQADATPTGSIARRTAGR